MSTKWLHTEKLLAMAAVVLFRNEIYSITSDTMKTTFPDNVMQSALIGRQSRQRVFSGNVTRQKNSFQNNELRVVIVLY